IAKFGEGTPAAVFGWDRISVIPVTVDILKEILPRTNREVEVGAINAAAKRRKRIGDWPGGATGDPEAQHGRANQSKTREIKRQTKRPHQAPAFKKELPHK